MRGTGLPLSGHPHQVAETADKCVDVTLAAAAARKHCVRHPATPAAALDEATYAPGIPGHDKMSAMASEEPLPCLSSDAADSLIACPCCSQKTLGERANFEICPECGWEYDGQDDANAHIVRGGPNGGLSLTQARLEYLEDAAGGFDDAIAFKFRTGTQWVHLPESTATGEVSAPGCGCGPATGLGSGCSPR